jgi:hypothetical protein
VGLRVVGALVAVESVSDASIGLVTTKGTTVIVSLRGSTETKRSACVEILLAGLQWGGSTGREGRARYATFGRETAESVKASRQNMSRRR